MSFLHHPIKYKVGQTAEGELRWQGEKLTQQITVILGLNAF